MPAMASITVKKADETTNITYDALAPSGGDGSNAVWRQDTGAVAGLPTGHRAQLRCKSQYNGPRTARRVTLEFSRPYSVLNSSTGRYETRDQDVWTITGTLPDAIPNSERAESVHQFLNLAASALIKSVGDTGFAPQ